MSLRFELQRLVREPRTHRLTLSAVRPSYVESRTKVALVWRVKDVVYVLKLYSVFKRAPVIFKALF